MPRSSPSPSLGRRAEGPALRRRRWLEVEATSGFEPLNRGFADLRVKPLHHVASGSQPGDCAIGARVRPGHGPGGTAGSREVVAPRGFEPRPTDPKSAVLPLDEGAADSRGGSRRDRLPMPGTSPARQRNGAEDGTRTRDPHLGKVMLYQLSHFRSEAARQPVLVPRARFELATPRFSVACSTN